MSWQRVYQIIQMDEDVTVGEVAGVEVTGELFLVNALDLVGDGDGVADVVIHSGDAKQNCLDESAVLADHLFGIDLRFGVVPLGFQG